MTCAWHERGSLLVITLWLIAVLSLIAVGLANYLSAEVRLSGYQLARAQAKSWAKTGLYLAMERLAEDAKDADEACDWLDDDWAGPLDVPMENGGGVIVQVTDDERRLDLNGEAASVAVLSNLLEVGEVAEAVMGYRKPERGPARTIRVMEELFDIPAVQAHQETGPVLRAQTTVYTQGHVNLNTASAALLQAMKGGAVSED